MSGSVRIGADGVRFTIDPGTLDPGEHVYITTSGGALSSVGVAVGTTRPQAPCPPPFNP